MRKIFRYVAACVLFCALCAPAPAQQPGRLAKVGWLRARPSSVPGSASVEIRTRLRELGYIEGTNIAFEYRYTDGKRERIPAAIDELVRMRVDIILASSAPEAVAAKEATKTIPIIFYSGSDPVSPGLGGEPGAPPAEISPDSVVGYFDLGGSFRPPFFGL